MAVSAQASAAPTTIAGQTSPALRMVLKIIVYIVLILFTLVEFLPFLWALSTSFKPSVEINAGFPPHWIPENPTLENYQNLFTLEPFAQWFLNSMIVGLATTLLVLFFASTSGYAFARIPFPGRNIMFLAILATMMIPGIITYVPIYNLVKALGLYNNLLGLIIPFMVTAFGVFLMRQFFLSIPLELEEAARMDGAGRFRTYWQIALPLAKPALSALALFTFMGRWNDFTMPLIIIADADKFTLPLGMSTFRGEYKTDWGVLMSGSILVMIPIVILYLAFQRFFVESVTYTGVKG